MFIITIISTAIVMVQNVIMFRFGLKEAAILAFPLSFVGIPLAEIISVWAGYFCIPSSSAPVEASPWPDGVIMVLGMAELVLPASYFATAVRQLGRGHVLRGI